MRRRVRLTEGQLMDIIEEATMRVIQEAGMLRAVGKYAAQNPGAKMFQRSNNANQNQRPLQQIFYGTNTKPSKEALARIPTNTDDGSRMWAAVNQNPEKFGMTRNQLMQHKQNMQNPETQKWLKGYANAVKQGNQGTNNSMFQRSNQNQNANQGGGGIIGGLGNAVNSLGNAVTGMFQRSNNANQKGKGAINAAGNAVARANAPFAGLGTAARSMGIAANQARQGANTARGAVNNAVRQAGQGVSRLFGGK